MKSMICWNIVAMMYRLNKDYVTAVKHYKMALMKDPKNAMILRDICLL